MERVASLRSVKDADLVERAPYTFKCIVLGDANVGKTSLVNRFHKNIFKSTSNVTMGMDKVSLSERLVGGRTATLELWDTAGQERFRSLTSSYYRNVDGILFVYDVTNHVSLAHIVDWQKEVDCNIKDSSKTVKFLVGTKTDLRNNQSIEPQHVRVVFQDFIDGFYQVSCKSGENVTETRAAFCEVLIKSRQDSPLPRTASTICLSATERPQQDDGKKDCGC